MGKVTRVGVNDCTKNKSLQFNFLKPFSFAFFEKKFLRKNGKAKNFNVKSNKGLENQNHRMLKQNINEFQKY